jgi:hypothetical protein
MLKAVFVNIVSGQLNEDKTAILKIWNWQKSVKSGI